jgi:hypothetical protein
MPSIGNREATEPVSLDGLFSRCRLPCGAGTGGCGPVVHGRSSFRRTRACPAISHRWSEHRSFRFPGSRGFSFFSIRCSRRAISFPSSEAADARRNGVWPGSSANELISRAHGGCCRQDGRVADRVSRCKVAGRASKATRRSRWRRRPGRARSAPVVTARHGSALRQALETAASANLQHAVAEFRSDPLGHRSHQVPRRNAGAPQAPRHGRSRPGLPRTAVPSGQQIVRKSASQELAD